MQLRQALEEALVSNPDDLAAHSAYADLLMEADRPADVARGELIQVQLSLEREGADRGALEERAAALLAKHGRAWLGKALAPYLIDKRTDDLPHHPQRVECRFARGWLDVVRVNALTPGLAEALASFPAARLLRVLEVDWLHDHKDCHIALVHSPYLGNLRYLQVGGNEHAGSGGGQGLVHFVGRLPRLEALVLMVHRVETKALFGLPTLTNLRRLQVYHVDHYPLAVLAANPALRNLTHLLLRPHALYPDDVRAYITLKDVWALVASRHLTSLTHLELSLCDMGDEGCTALVRSGILGRLEELTLRHGCITDAGARVLSACPGLRHLKKLDLTDNLLSEVGLAALRATGVSLLADNQRDPADERDVSDEDHYLWNGDWE